MQTLNFTLEVINGSISILTYFVLLFLGYYLITELGLKRFTWKNLFIISTAIGLAFSLFIEQLGSFLTRMIIWFWRMAGANVPFTPTQNGMLVLGAAITMVGLIMMIRVLSRPRFGEWPWVIATAIVVSYDALAVALHFVKR